MLEVDAERAGDGVKSGLRGSVGVQPALETLGGCLFYVVVVVYHVTIVAMDMGC